MSLSEKYSDYKWIKVKRGKVFFFDDERYVTEEHHVEETTFLIEEVRKLAAEVDRLNGLSKDESSSQSPSTQATLQAVQTVLKSMNAEGKV